MIKQSEINYFQPIEVALMNGTPLNDVFSNNKDVLF